MKAMIFATSSRKKVYELGIKPENAVHFLSKVVTVSSEFEHAAAAAENTVKLKDEKKLKLASDSKWGGGAENTFSQSLFTIFKKVRWWGGGGPSHPLPLCGLCEVEEEEQEQEQEEAGEFDVESNNSFSDEDIVLE